MAAVPDAAGRTQHQHALALPHGGPAGQREIHRVVVHQQRHRFGVIEFGGAAGHVGQRSEHLLGVAAQDAERRNPVADFEFGVLRRPVDHARGFHAGDERRRQLELVLAFAQQQIRKADPGGTDVDDQNVVVAGDVLDIGVDETVRA